MFSQISIIWSIADSDHRHRMNADEAEAAEWRANSAMIEEKARSLLNRNERHVLRLCCSAYKSRQIDVDHYVDTLLGLLTTPSKVNHVSM